MKKFNIPLYEPSLSGNEIKYVNDCLDSNWISSKGKYVQLFEKNFSKYLGINYSVAVSNGTNALHLALLCLGIKSDDEVIVPTLTYVASVNCISYIGAKPVFADCLEDSWQINPDDIKRKITKKTKAIILVHLYGHPCEMGEILKIAKKNNLFVIEDCSEAIGSRYKNNLVGTFGDIATFSFYGNKTITTGEGGMVVTNNFNFFKKCIHLKNQGLVKNREYWHDVIGYNYRMTNICAAIGLAQLEQIDNFILKKKKISEIYKKNLNDLPLIVHKEKKNCFHTYWAVTILLDNFLEKNKLRKYLQSKGVETRPMFFPVHTMPMYKNKFNYYPVSEFLTSKGISLPSSLTLDKKKIKIICNFIKNYFR
jgi:perosamine synthetase